jgi:membrane-associated phospholipid phosphatase
MVERPILVEQTIFTPLVFLIYSHDLPFNCFPSTHVSLSLISGAYWIKQAPHSKVYITVFVVLVAASTLFVKQHYIVDVAGGAILGLLSISVGYCLSPMENQLYPFRGGG